MLGLFFGGQKFQSTFGNQYGNIELDAMLDESHEWSADVTSNPVEDGAPVTDHVIEQADKLTIRGVVTDAPLNASSSILGFIGGGSADNKNSLCLAGHAHQKTRSANGLHQAQNIQ